MCNVCKYANLYGDAIHCSITHTEVFKRCDNFKLDEVLENEMLKEENENLKQQLDGFKRKWNSYQAVSKREMELDHLRVEELQSEYKEEE
jgi:predicted RNase H-like nuclease (RuvC/YqgF family)